LVATGDCASSVSSILADSPFPTLSFVAASNPAISLLFRDPHGLPTSVVEEPLLEIEAGPEKVLLIPLNMLEGVMDAGLSLPLPGESPNLSNTSLPIPHRFGIFFLGGRGGGMDPLFTLPTPSIPDPDMTITASKEFFLPAVLSINFSLRSMLLASFHTLYNTSCPIKPHNSQVVLRRAKHHPE
jgi:hypothetical protein